MVYFKQRPYTPRSTEELDQWKLVLDFQNHFPKEGLWWPYTSTAIFKDLLRKHLERFIRDSVPLHPPDGASAAANRVIAFLQDRRVLYAPGEQQVPAYCTLSVREIREFLRSEIQKDPAGELYGHLEAMAGACRKFLSFEQTQKNWSAFDPLFGDALSQMRAIFGEHISFIAARYKVNLKDELKSILPVPNKD